MSLSWRLLRSSVKREVARDEPPVLSLLLTYRTLLYQKEERRWLGSGTTCSVLDTVDHSRLQLPGSVCVRCSRHITTTAAATTTATTTTTYCFFADVLALTWPFSITDVRFVCKLRQWIIHGRRILRLANGRRQVVRKGGHLSVMQTTTFTRSRHF